MSLGKILVVDDDRSLIEVLKIRIESAGYEVTTALKEETAINAAKSQEFDLAIVDLQLERTDGITLMQKLRPILPGMAVIILTAHGTIESAVEAMRQGAFSYVTKPFSAKDLLFQIEKALENREQKNEIQRLKKLAEARMYHMATHDGLTDLPNLRLAMDRLSMALSEARRRKTMAAVMFIDLDGFKAVNDTLGHEAGDQVLKQVARRLLSCVRETDTVSRVGGDEFLVIATGLRTPENAELLAEKILQLVSQPVISNGQQPVISASIGIAFYPDHGEDKHRLIKLADETMYRVKHSGKNGYGFANTVKPRQLPSEGLQSTRVTMTNTHSTVLRNVEILIHDERPGELEFLPDGMAYHVYKADIGAGSTKLIDMVSGERYSVALTNDGYEKADLDQHPGGRPSCFSTIGIMANVLRKRTQKWMARFQNSFETLKL